MQYIYVKYDVRVRVTRKKYNNAYVSITDDSYDKRSLLLYITRLYKQFYPVIIMYS